MNVWSGSVKHWAIGICTDIRVRVLYIYIYWGVMRHVIETSLPLVQHTHTHTYVYMSQLVQW